MTPSGIKPATFRIVTLCLKQMRYLLIDPYPANVENMVSS